MQATITQRRPSVKIHRASPPSTPPHSQSMIAQQNPFAGGVWPEMGMGATGLLSALPRNFQDPRYHKRASSGSSIASNGPDSPLDQANIYQPRIATSEAHYSPSRFDVDYSPHAAKIVHAMPDSMMFHTNPVFGGAIDMRRLQSTGQDDRASYAGAQSVSTMSHHNSPATPQTWEDSYTDDQHFGGGYPTAAYTQSLQDVFPERQMQQMPYQIKQMQNGRHTLQEQYARSQQQHLRTNSPTSNPRERSPFKPNMSMMRSQQMPQPQATPGLHKERTSISPKELMLDDHDVDDNQAAMFPAVPNFSRQNSNYYTAPSFSQETSLQIPQHYPFVSQSSSQNIPVDSTPDFPAHMVSMESTNEEGPSEPSSQQSLQHPQPRHEVLSRPADVSSDSGTYSCTYHGCPQRFETAAKLQKHKREGHRQHETVAATTAANLKNSQAGPHRCDRINPSTGKPCNSIFSRPYDLTRHEDTIHNARKMKVRCHLCTEEKTFSRNDALTRHMRVVHPDVDWVGKQKRKSHR